MTSPAKRKPLKRVSLKDLEHTGPTPLAEFLAWVADRLVYVHGDQHNVDFVYRLRRMAEILSPLGRKGSGR